MIYTKQGIVLDDGRHANAIVVICMDGIIMFYRNGKLELVVRQR